MSPPTIPAIACNFHNSRNCLPNPQLLQLHITTRHSRHRWQVAATPATTVTVRNCTPPSSPQLYIIGCNSRNSHNCSANTQLLQLHATVRNFTPPSPQLYVIGHNSRNCSTNPQLHTAHRIP